MVEEPGCGCGPESCCTVDSLVTVDERGQMVLPKKLRDRAGIKAGDRLAVVTFEREGKVCCLSLIRTEELAGLVTGFMGPFMKEIFTGE